MNKTKAKQIQKWFLRYGITKAQKTLIEFYRFSSDEDKRYVWQIFIDAVRKTYNKGYKDGFERGKELTIKRMNKYKDGIPEPILHYLDELNVK